MIQEDNAQSSVVEIRAACECADVDIPALKRYAGRVLVETGNEQYELSILLADDDYVRDLNKRYRRVKRTTNVLAFPQQDDSDELPFPALLGDVVICVEKARRDCAVAGNSLFEELMKLIVHGVLHLSGYDHRTSSQMRRMRQLEQMTLEKTR